MPKLIKKDPIHISVKDRGKGITVEPGFSYTFILDEKELAVEIIEAEDALFRSNSALFLPTAIEDESASQSDYQVFESNDTLDSQAAVSGLNVICGFFRYYQFCIDRGDVKHVLITGHADSVGKESSNEKLSQKRAAIVESIILGGKDSRTLFVKNVVKKHTKKDQQHILNWLVKTLGVANVDKLNVDGKIGSKTSSAIRAVKKELRSDSFPSNRYSGFGFSDDIEKIRKTLINNTEFAANLWVFVFELYQAEMYVALKNDNFNLEDIRANLKWVDAERKAVGCGETWPVEARGQDNYKSQSNRRVEILFYDPHELKGNLPCHDDKCAEEECHIFKNIDKYAPRPLDVHLKWTYIPLRSDGTLYNFIGIANFQNDNKEKADDLFILECTSGKQLSGQKENDFDRNIFGFCELHQGEKFSLIHLSNSKEPTVQTLFENRSYSEFSTAPTQKNNPEKRTNCVENSEFEEDFESEDINIEPYQLEYI